MMEVFFGNKTTCPARLGERAFGQHLDVGMLALGPYDRYLYWK
jgi:hypothetical protein